MLEGMRVISDRQFSLMLETMIEALPQVCDATLLP
jgi:hypothetical protein